MAGVYFEEANEVKEIAEELINKYHPHLKDAKKLIGYYFREGAMIGQEKRRNVQRLRDSSQEKCFSFSSIPTTGML
jgi:Putative phage metallopeptidase